MNEREIFLAAIAKTDPAERAAYLNVACGGDEELRHRLGLLLAAHAQAQEFLEAPASGVAATIDRPILEQVGAQIGPYKLLQKLGEGGFGVVYMAEQEKPVRRMVALKIIKPGMDTREVIARFESERQALAIMDHPNIAKVFDAGATETGRPYFVMELVKGVPITDFCDRNHMPARQRLGLFVTACQAIQHAHHKGVIHRDIKPSNVMVTLHDGVPVVKVIDFGVAKATSQKLTEKTLFTAYGQMIGTPAYMSPEQAEMSGLDIDTRSDIYSLGVLLYELLTGTTPLDIKQLRAAGYAEMQRLIREEEAPRPSTRLSSLKGDATLLAGNRGTDPRRLAQLLAGDLDWIVMKALEKDRNRRYASPGSFAEDVERFLHQEAILARPPSAIYKLRKFAQRNRVAVFLMLFVPATILAVLSNHIIGLHRTRAQRDRAVAAERLASDRLAQVEKANVEAQQALADAQASKGETERALKESEQARQVTTAVSNFLIEGIRSLDPSMGGREMDVTSLLEEAATKLDTEFAGPPKMKGDMLSAVGTVYFGLGLHEQAIDMQIRAVAVLTATVGPDHADTIFAMNRLGGTFRQADRLREAVEVFEETVKRAKASFAPDHATTLQSMNGLAVAYNGSGRLKDGVPLLEETLEKSKSALGPADPFTLTIMRNLAAAYRAAGRPADSLPLYKDVLRLRPTRLGPDHPNQLGDMFLLASAYREAKRAADAITLLEELLQQFKVRVALDHNDTLNTMGHLGWAYSDAGRLGDAIGLWEERLRLTKAKLGADHLDTIEAMRPLGPAYQEVGRLNDSIKHREEILAIQKAKFGADHQDPLFTMGRLAGVYQAAGRHVDAVALLEHRLRLTQAKSGSDHADTVEAMRPLGQAYQAAGRLAESIAHREALLPLMKSKYGPDHEETLVLMNNLTDAYRTAGRLADAISLGAETLPLAIAKYGTDDLRSVRAMMYLAWAYRDAKRFAEAIPLWEEMFRVRKAKLGEGHTDTINVMRSLGSAYRQVGRMADSLAIREETLPLLKAKLGPEHSDTLTFMSNLGSDYSQCGEHARAEPLLLAAYQGMKQPANITSETAAARTEILQRLVRLYEAWDKAADAAKWRSELEASGKAAAK